MQNQQSECVYEVILTIILGEDDVTVKLCATRSIGSTHCRPSQHQGARRDHAVDHRHSPISKTTCQSE